MEEKCNGNRYNFKMCKTEICQKKDSCRFYVGINVDYYNEDGKKPITFNSMKDFRECKKHLKNIVAIDWWLSLDFEQRFYKTIEANSVLNGDTVDNHPDKLTENDIVKVFNWHKKIDNES